jgi:hypothetical protein
LLTTKKTCSIPIFKRAEDVVMPIAQGLLEGGD